MKKANPAKELYHRLRVLSCEQLWTEEVPAFDRADARGRMDRVGLIRAVGVVFSESGTPAQREQARQWLRALLHDPEEKIRRYAMTALPKIGAEAGEEIELLRLLEKTASDREKESLSRTLEKIGGSATLKSAAALASRSLQKVEANVARHENPGVVCLDRPLKNFADLRMHLHCREGLEEILEDELQEQIAGGAKFRLVRRRPGRLEIAPTGPFMLADLYALRCFSAVGLVLGTVRNETGELAALMASPLARQVFETFTEGPIRYRLEFVSKGHQRAAVRGLAARVYELCPALLNDPRHAPWQINILETPPGCSPELTPRLRPDPRFAYRQDDVPAASHPPLAAAMARLAGRMENETIWDPFCGSGLELIERTLRGGVGHVFGTDRSAEAIAITRENFAAAVKNPPASTLARGDFRDHAAIAGLKDLSLIITNPPMGRRVPIPNLPGLIADLFAAAAAVLRPGGRLVFANPLPVEPRGHSLKRAFRRKVDLGGFHVNLEKYLKQ